ncbi:MAG: hypothetical protein DYH20_01005 [Gammaproteobacteria bacterium PRO9]|nr:hypothetical protein [Gammaproteobacteria bacterium PRO9]
MPYLLVENFSGGLDDRKSPLTAAPGTLSYCNNAHLTAGGEIEKRKAFVPVVVFTPDVQCLGGWSGVGKQWLFGNGARPAVLPPQFEWVDVRVDGYRATRIVRVQSWGDEPRALIEYPVDVRYLWAGHTKVDLTNSNVWSWPGLPWNRIRDIAVLDQKLYTCQATILECSGVAEPEKHGATVTGSAVYDASKFGPRAYDLTAMAVYQNRLLTFAKDGAVVWQVDPDPDQTRPLQFLGNFGCVASKSIVEYGEADTFFLSYSGVRSIRARDSSNIATVSDVGSPINKTLTAHLSLLLESGNADSAVGCYEPKEGRYWLAMYDVIYVLSFFPSAKVTAWSTYTPGFRVSDMWSHENTLFVLSEDALYSSGAYQGNADTDYDRTVVEVELPWLNGGEPATVKTFTGFDIACEGKWQAFAGFNTRDPSADEVHTIVTGDTYSDGAQALSGQGTHVKLRLRSDFDGYAKLDNLAVHYELEEAA